MSRTNDYIGKRFKSKDGYWYEVVERITFDNVASKSRYKIRFEDGTELVAFYTYIRYGKVVKDSESWDRCKTFKKYISSKFDLEQQFLSNNLQNLVDAVFESRDGYLCRLLQISNSVHHPNKLSYAKCVVEFESGFKCILTGNSLIKGTFEYLSLYSKANQLTLDNYKYDVFDKFKSNNRNTKYLGVVYSDGFKDILPSTSVSSGFRRFRNNKNMIRLISKISNNYYVCQCDVCSMKNIMTYDEIYEHKKRHILGETS